MKKKIMVSAMALCVAGCIGACSVVPATDTTQNATSTEISTQSTYSQNKLSRESIPISNTLSSSSSGEHAITVDGKEESYSNTEVLKTGDSSGDEADFYGENSAIFTTNKGTSNLTNMVVDTNGAHANAVFSYGEGTTVNISDSYITTSGNCSGALMTTGGGTMNATNVTAETTGNSSATIRSDRGGGTVTVNGGNYKTSGTGSPTIYSTADITVNDSYLESTASQGVVVEGNNSVTLNNTNLTANNNKKNSNKSDYYQAVMLYQSMSGDASEGMSSFKMNGGSLNNANGDIFFVNNTTSTIELSNANITNNDTNGVFLRAAAAGWGNSGSNGGKVNLKASNQVINGDMVVDDISSLNLYLNDNSTFTGAVNSSGQSGKVYVELKNGSKWTLTADSYISSLTCDADSINLNGHKLYVNGVEYTENMTSQGTAIEMASGDSKSMSKSSNNMEKPSDANAPDKGSSSKKTSKKKDK